jgi:hypothetical protein
MRGIGADAGDFMQTTSLDMRDAFSAHDYFNTLFPEQKYESA